MSILITTEVTHLGKNRSKIHFMKIHLMNINGFTINLTWRDYVHTVENKTAKNIGLLYQGKHYLDDNWLRKIYFAYIYTYLNYANIPWASTHKIKLKKVQNKSLESFSPLKFTKCLLN